MKKEEHINILLVNIFKHLGETPTIAIDIPDEGIYSIAIEGQSLSFLIGYRGQSLEALQNIIGMALFRRYGDPTTIILDINGYKEKKAERIRDLTRKYIDKVRFLGTDIALPFMTPWERRQVHTLISEYDDIESESTGEGSSRRVVLKTKAKS